MLNLTCIVLCMDIKVNDNSNSDEGDSALRQEVNLQELIRARKAERKQNAKQKRQINLKRIREMNSTIGIHPLEQFPKEIWIEILDDLGPEDRVSVWQVHPLFRDLMENTRIQDLLLPLVLKLDEFHDSNRGNLGSHFHEKLRLISKTTRNSFDRWMDDTFMKRIREKEADFFEIHDHDIVNLHFEDFHPSNPEKRRRHKEIIACFGGEVMETHRKCFFPRGLGLCFSDNNLDVGEENIEELIKEYKNDISSILKNIGDQIWHFRFFLYSFDKVDFDFDFSDLHPMLREWLTLMPNLKWLELDIGYVGVQMTYEKGEMPSFPRLNNLERLTLHSNYLDGDFKRKASHNICGAILEANKHNLKMLDLTQQANGCENEIIPYRLTQDLQLTWLAVCDEEWFGGECTTASYITLENIKKMIPNYNWPLQTIILSGLLAGSDKPEDEETITIDEPMSIVSVFQFLQQFPTLERVEIKELHEFNFYDIHKMDYLRLPNLTLLALGITGPGIDYDDSDINFFFSLQFLVHCKKLQRITWKLDWHIDLEFRNYLEEFEKKTKGEIVDFRGGMKYLYDSNIWDVFLDLKKVNVHVKVENANKEKGFCEHVYFRKEIEDMSVLRFLNSHRCSRERDLRFCVMLMK